MRKYLFLALITTAVTFTACTSGGTKDVKNNNIEASAEQAVDVSEKHTLLAVGGSCDMCTDRIVSTANKIEGVTQASYNLEKQELHLHYLEDKTDIDDISKSLADVGHDTELYKATQDVYDALPGCCKYRK